MNVTNLNGSKISDQNYEMMFIQEDDEYPVILHLKTCNKIHIGLLREHPAHDFHMTRAISSPAVGYISRANHLQDWERIRGLN